MGERVGFLTNYAFWGEELADGEQPNGVFPGPITLDEAAAMLRDRTLTIPFILQVSPTRRALIDAIRGPLSDVLLARTLPQTLDARHAAVLRELRKRTAFRVLLDQLQSNDPETYDDLSERLREAVR